MLLDDFPHVPELLKTYYGGHIVHVELVPVFGDVRLTPQIFTFGIAVNTIPPEQSASFTVCLGLAYQSAAVYCCQVLDRLKRETRKVGVGTRRFAMIC
jgi:hypothetical protein